MSVLSLLINDERFYGWTSIRVTRGLERAAADFALGVSHVEPWPIYPGAACKVFIDNDLVITGWVDTFRPSVSATEHRIECTGRSKTCDFVD
ncbi:MAG: phage tail protein, partial [Alphaproteobacteria bacterium]|nr:phage tail protein [Alphaproteobacteria bacterium]